MDLSERIEAFAALGAFLRDFNLEEESGREDETGQLNRAIDNAYRHNPWFTPPMCLAALKQIGRQLSQPALTSWLASYPALDEPGREPACVGIVMAGNIPAVGFHDLMCVLLAGHKALIKLSSGDRFLIPFMTSFLIARNQGFTALVEYSGQTISGYDAVIATGSNNTSRYFESYFSRVPHIIRKNRNSVAVLSGNEDPTQLSGLCEDIFSYFGLGCRSVSHLFVPEGYAFDSLLSASEAFSGFASHHKYASNYMYYKTIFLMNQRPFADNGILMLTPESAYNSPVSVVYYSTYKEVDQVIQQLTRDREQLQCVISAMKEIPGSTDFGKSQQPALNEYADGVDTLSFLEGIH